MTRYDYCGSYSELKTGEERSDFINLMIDETQQSAVVTTCYSTFEMRLKSQVESEKIRTEMIAPMLMAYCAALCEITLWPPSRR